MPRKIARTSVRGSAMLYILIAVAMMGALTASLMESSDGTASRVQKAQKLANELESQITFMRAAIQECVLRYPGGDPTIVVGTGVDANYVHPYPLEPTETHFTGSTLGVAPNSNVENLRCPGNPGVNNNHIPLFGSDTRRFFPTRPDHFGDWIYYNGSGTIASVSVNGVFIRISSSRTDAYIADALSILEDQYEDCEADHIAGNGSNGCTAGQQCFWYWLIRKSAC